MLKDTLEIFNKFELHYHFTDDSHYMDAIIRHKCEGEILHIFTEITQLLEINLDIETEAFYEGGLKERWKLFSENKFFAVLVATIIGQVSASYLTKDVELNELQKEELRLEIQYKKINIEKLSKNPNNKEAEKSLYVELSKDTILYLNNSQKTIKHKSNFYKNLYNYSKITKISSNKLTDDGTSSEPVITL